MSRANRRCELPCHARRGSQGITSLPSILSFAVLQKAGNNTAKAQHLNPEDLEPPKPSQSPLMNEDHIYSFFTNCWYFTGTVLPHILPQIILATVVATIIYLWQLHGCFNIAIPSNGHTALGTQGTQADPVASVSLAAIVQLCKPPLPLPLPHSLPHKC